MTTKMPKLPLHKIRIAVSFYLNELKENPKVSQNSFDQSFYALMAFIGRLEVEAFKNGK